MTYIIGIDPGLSGGVRIINKAGVATQSMAMPTVKLGKKNVLDLKSLNYIIHDHKPCTVVIEAQQAMPKQGVSSMFSIGKGFGQLEGLCVGLDVPYHIIRPREWQKEMFTGLPKGNTKDHSKLIAQRLFPHITFKKSDRCINIHDGMTDAILIAEYGRRKFK